MNKKAYNAPLLEVTDLKMNLQLMVSSGPGAGDQSDPGMAPEMDDLLPLSPEELLGIPL